MGEHRETGPANRPIFDGTVARPTLHEPNTVLRLYRDRLSSNRYAVMLRYFAYLLLVAAAVPSPAAAAGQQSDQLFRRCFENRGAAALRHCEHLADQRRDDYRVQRRKAFLYVEVNRYREAFAALENIARRWPNDWRAHYDLANAYSFVRAYKRAIPPIERSLKLAPRNREVLMLANTIYGVRNRDRAAFRAALAAARLGDRVGMFVTSYRYEDGIGTKKDIKSAWSWLFRAAEAGHIAAMERVTQIYLEGGLGVAADDRKAEAWALKTYRTTRGAASRVPVTDRRP